VREKGTGLLIESLPEILKTYPAATLDVIGTGSALCEFKVMADRLRLQDRVKFWGKLEHSELMRVLRHSDLFCYPTRASEGFPKVVLEALACGLPVITTRVSVLPQLMSSGGGIVIDELSPAAVAAAVRSALRDRQTYLAMSEKAAETATRFSLEEWRNEIGGLLRAAWGTI
jgi:glycosyltransferase involved in cell wall biosynthesis